MEYYLSAIFNQSVLTCLAVLTVAPVADNAYSNLKFSVFFSQPSLPGPLSDCLVTDFIYNLPGSHLVLSLVGGPHSHLIMFSIHVLLVLSILCGGK